MAAYASHTWLLHKATPRLATIAGYRREYYAIDITIRHDIAAADVYTLLPLASHCTATLFIDGYASHMPPRCQRRC